MIKNNNWTRWGNPSKWQLIQINLDILNSSISINNELQKPKNIYVVLSQSFVCS